MIPMVLPSPATTSLDSAHADEDVLRRWAITAAVATKQIRGRVLTVFTVNRRQKQVNTIMTTPL
ncbi:hypothetical protein E7Z53_19390 [Kocuria salina]|uniref:hypothetical protein n=1 Tax=Kocuria salina TaxID=1929416 RepID=UPI0015939DAF|nr:hypothetical protein [Kocuria salina]NVC25578.1 hypothetical protein [Kocuria salina]